jgi:hypothetical protein
LSDEENGDGGMGGETTPPSMMTAPGETGRRRHR